MKPAVSAVRRNVFASSLVLAAIAAAELAGQGQGAAPRARQSFTSTSTAILVDVVVRDNHGRPVTDLSAARFRRRRGRRPPEDRQLQPRVARRRDRCRRRLARAPRDRDRQAEPARRPESSRTPRRPPRRRRRRWCSIICRRKRCTSRRRPRSNTCRMSGESSVQVGVFASDLGVRALQRYTNDRALVRRAVARVMPVGGSDEEQRSDRTDELIERRKALAGEAESAGASAAQGSGAVLAQNAGTLGERENELHLVQTEINMLRSIESSERSRRGYDTSLSLLAVVRSLAEYPGRKTIVFFSEGLPVSPVLIGEAGPRDRRGEPLERDRLRGRHQRPPRQEHNREGPEGARRLRGRAARTGRRRDGPDRTAAQHGDGARRGHAPARFARRPRAIVRRHRRVPGRGIQRSLGGVPADRRGQPVPLPAHLRADQRHARRPLPRDPGQGRPAGHAGVRAQRLPRAPRAPR